MGGGAGSSKPAVEGGIERQETPRVRLKPYKPRAESHSYKENLPAARGRAVCLLSPAPQQPRG